MTIILVCELKDAECRNPNCSRFHCADQYKLEEEALKKEKQKSPAYLALLDKAGKAVHDKHSMNDEYDWEMAPRSVKDWCLAVAQSVVDAIMEGEAPAKGLHLKKSLRFSS